jgi:hypothetical protein
MGSSVYSIRCTNCGAPLKILGGGRVTTVTCSYCNSVLDLENEYKILSQFRNKYRPRVPFTLGMQGKIKEVEWTIIGWISYKTIDYPIERWSEFFLYSPLYGYGWLVYEEGVLSFSKRIRDFPLREWQEKKRPGTVFYQRGHYLLDEASYIAEIDFVQGELSWIAKANDKVQYWDYNGVNRRSLSIEKSKNEIEVYLNETLDTQKIYESFGVPKEKQVKAKQSISDKIFEKGDLEQTEKTISTFSRGIILLAAILLFAIIASFFTDKTVVKNHTNQPFETLFTIDSDAFLTQIELKAPSPGALNACRLTLYRADQKIFSIDKTNLFSTNSHLQYTWLSGDDEVTLYLKLNTGLYRLSLEFLTPLSSSKKVTVTVKERVMRLSYIVPLFILILMMLLPALKRNLIPQRSVKFFWWGTAAVVGFALFGFGIVIFIVVLYFLVQPIIDARNIRREE